MKTKKNKKFYNFTEKQKRKKRSCGETGVPKYYRQMFNRERKAKARQTLKKLLSGKEVEFEVEKKDVGWYYW